MEQQKENEEMRFETEEERKYMPLTNSERKVSTVLRVCFELVENIEPYPDRPEVIDIFPKQYCDCSCQCVN